MATVAEMVTNVQANAPSLSLTSDQILPDLNAALRDLFEEAELEATTGVGDEAAMVTVASQQRYALPSNCVKARYLQWRLSSTLRQVNYLQLDAFRRLAVNTAADISPESSSLYWTVWGSSLLLYPTPTAAGSAGGDGELVLDFYKVPATLTSNSTPDIPTQYHQLLEWYATGMAYAKADEGQWAEWWLSRYREGKGQMARERTINERAMPAKVRLARW